jgi:hypothetical protein
MEVEGKHEGGRQIFSPRKTLADFHSCMRRIRRRAGSTRGRYVGDATLPGVFCERWSCCWARDGILYIKHFPLVLVLGGIFLFDCSARLEDEVGVLPGCSYLSDFLFRFLRRDFQDSSPGLLGLILPLHLFAMVCMFYLSYFVAKSLVLAETSKPASFSDYAGPFFLLWFCPVGIWIVQPRVNRLYSGRKNFEFPVETNPH